jgi:hypothetical protein
MGENDSEEEGQRPTALARRITFPGPGNITLDLTE